MLTAHLDHVGIGATRIDGDSIYNGAQDNAVGIGAMLEAGRLLAATARSCVVPVLLVATTAEEKGLLGAQYFASHPTVPVESMVANVNLDMPTHIAEVSDLIPIGIEHSTLEPIARDAVAAAGLSSTPDPMPDEVIFVRSDQYRFVREGVPAVYLLSGHHPQGRPRRIGGVPRVDGQALPQAERRPEPADRLAGRRASCHRESATSPGRSPRRRSDPPGNPATSLGEKFGRMR